MTLDGTVRVVLGMLLAFIFLRAAWHKVADTRRFIAQLGAYRLLPGPILPLLAGLFILLEVYLAATLPLPGWRSSALLAAALLCVYALAMGINLARDRHDLDCGCGGPAGDAQAISWALVVRNGFLATLALIAALPVATRSWSPLDVGTALLAGVAACLLYSSIEQAIANWQRERRYAAERTSYSILSPTNSLTNNPTAGPKISSATSHTSSPRAAGGAAVSALAVSHLLLWVIVVILCIVVFALLRQIGVLHERVFPAGALMNNRGPQAGDPAPVQELRALDDSRITLGDGIRSTLLLFVSPTCPVCKTLLPIVASVEKTERANHPLQVILASDGDSAQEQRQHLEFLDTHRLDKSRYVVSKPLGLAFVVEKLPFAALIDRAGVIRAKGLVNSREHLESLFEAHERGVSSLQEYLANEQT